MWTFKKEILYQFAYRYIKIMPQNVIIRDKVHELILSRLATGR